MDPSSALYWITIAVFIALGIIWLINVIKLGDSLHEKDESNMPPRGEGDK